MQMIQTQQTTSGDLDCTKQLKESCIPLFPFTWIFFFSPLPGLLLLLHALLLASTSTEIKVPQVHSALSFCHAFQAHGYFGHFVRIKDYHDTNQWCLPAWCQAANEVYLECSFMMDQIINPSTFA